MIRYDTVLLHILIGMIFGAGFATYSLLISRMSLLETIGAFSFVIVAAWVVWKIENRNKGER